MKETPSVLFYHILSEEEKQLPLFKEKEKVWKASCYKEALKRIMKFQQKGEVKK